MQKTIHLFLMTFLVSLSAFAGIFDEYGYNNSSYGSPMYNTGAMGGGTYWSQLARDFYTQINAVNPYSYSQTIETKVKTSESYIVSSTQPADNPNTIVEKFVSRATGWDMWKIYLATTITSTQQNTVNLAQANTSVLNSYGLNTYFNFNVYNPAQQSYAYNTYRATTNGAVLVASATQSGPPPTPVPYTAIPRSASTDPLDTSSGSKFQTAIQLYSQQSLTLSEAKKVIVDYIDRVIPDATNGRVLFMQNTISKVAEGLPPSERGKAEAILIGYMTAVDPFSAFYDAIPRITRSNVDMGPNSDFVKAEQLFQKSSLTLAEALFVKREYFDIAIPDLKGGIDVYMNDLIDKVRDGLADEFKDSAEEALIRYATAELVVLDANLATPNTTDPKKKANFRNITNVSDVLSGKSWVPYVNNCNAAAKDQNAQSGLSNTTPVGAGMQANTFVDNKRQAQSGKTTSDIDMQKAVDIVTKNLKAGKPVMAGVMYERKYGADRISGGTQDDNNNVATNHYVTIVGMGVDSNGNPYFSYYDNFVDSKFKNGNTKSYSTMELQATNTNENRFYYYIDSAGNYYFSDESAKTLDGPSDTYTYPNSHGQNNEYILTEIRDNF